ncbi:substrate-binding domain-containing protein [Nitrospirillum iridis]|uniref:Quinoprotein dehydrogenase-associated probable ABC transporter substrate-binding protein n=1 Tax=Nitrospirillum iridis TaxID=765888 RepID=A0A7X0EEA2_9PROT|nr:substrate-binding domain-containing protein [Nitrospirillum iridis]MBB6253677.1 quinoprotein dehydrogenase-associated probable ABC transporter substrate-binding protein [Nitrospirillum iridis]
MALKTAFRLALAALAPLALITTQAAAQTAELVSRTELRICADPNDLPYSNQKGEGFENKIATLIGQDLKLPVSFVWFPQVMGFVRNTLRARQCDLVMGTVAGDPLMDNTSAYYHSGYMIVTRADSGIGATSLADPALADKRFGIVAATPPTDLLLRHNLMAHATSYALAVDTRYESPARAMLQDLADRKIDVALLWGPIAGFYIKHEKLPLKAAFLDPEGDSDRLDFRIAMGVRANEPEWRRTVDQALRRHRAEVDALLADYGIPLLDEQNKPIPGTLPGAGAKP